jgi:hypothetical protein
LTAPARSELHLLGAEKGSLQKAVDNLGANGAKMAPFFTDTDNPFMSLVAETKVNSSAWAVRNPDVFRKAATEFVAALDNTKLDKRGARLSLDADNAAFPDRDFFEEVHLRRTFSPRARLLSS